MENKRQDPISGEKMRKLGLDVGAKKIGLAVSDSSNQIAQPLTVLERENDLAEINKILAIIEENSVDEVVIGIPVSMSGEEGLQAETVRAYISKLKENCSLPVREWDERLTTALVEKVLISGHVSRKKRKKVIDKLAACVILQSYLDSLQARG